MFYHSGYAVDHFLSLRGRNPTHTNTHLLTHTYRIIGFPVFHTCQDCRITIHGHNTLGYSHNYFLLGEQGLQRLTNQFCLHLTQDSNPRQHGCELSALPLHRRPIIMIIKFFIITIIIIIIIIIIITIIVFTIIIMIMY